MTTGTLLIGCGFTPSQEDVLLAIQQGHLNHCQTITRLGLHSPVPVEIVLNTYLDVAQKEGWGDPGGLHVTQFVTQQGWRVWGVYPIGVEV